MRSIHQFIISPLNGKQYNDTKKVGDVELIVNASIEYAADTQRIGIVKELPLMYDGDVRIGDKVIVQHNVFRITLNDKGVPMQSNNFIKDDLFYVSPDLVYMAIRDGKKVAVGQFCFVQPIIENDKWEGEKEAVHRGIMKYPNRLLVENDINEGDEICFRFNCEYLFEIDNEKLYMMDSKRILAKLEVEY